MYVAVLYQMYTRVKYLLSGKNATKWKIYDERYDKKLDSQQSVNFQQNQIRWTINTVMLYCQSSQLTKRHILSTVCGGRDIAARASPVGVVELAW